MHWHHSGARRLAVLQVAAIRPDLKYTPTEKDMDQVHQVLESLEQGWLCHDPFLAGTAVSIADMLAYEEFAQVYMTGLFPQVAEYAKIAAWMQRMTELPFHDEVHQALAELGSLAEPNETPLNKRLSAATKSALAVFKKAQDDFVVSKL
jgi:glutathione S-transferase